MRKNEESCQHCKSQTMLKRTNEGLLYCRPCRHASRRNMIVLKEIEKEGYDPTREEPYPCDYCNGKKKVAMYINRIGEWWMYCYKCRHNDFQMRMKKPRFI